MDEQITPLQKGFDALHEHVIITDEKGVILYANKAVEQATGYPLQEILGKKPGELWGGKMPKTFYEKMWHVIKDEKKPFVEEVKNVRKDGTEYWQELHITPIVNMEGNVQYFIGIEPDITERKKREEFREEFFSIAKHQITSPLTKNNIILDLLLSQEGMEKHKEYIQQLYKDNVGIMTLINDLVFLSRMENQSLSKENVDLAEIIDETYTRVRESNAGIACTFIKEGTAFTINTNATLARQVFTNIISNAAEYSNANAGKISLVLKDTGSEFTFSCEDNGIGIPADEQVKIFQKFYRASNASIAKSEGTGLGLYIVKTICDQLGWKFSFTSAVDKGTTFYITIPK